MGDNAWVERATAVLEALANALLNHDVNEERIRRMGGLADQAHTAVESLRQKELDGEGPITKA